MKIEEISSSLISYTCQVRVVSDGSSIIARTTLAADNFAQAKAILTRIYGMGNVLSVSEIVRESLRADQIQHRATFKDKTAQRPNKKPTTGPVHFSHFEEDGANRVLSPDEQRVKAMSDQAKRLQQQAKQMKAQKAVKKAQQQLKSTMAQPH